MENKRPDKGAYSRITGTFVLFYH